MQRRPERISSLNVERGLYVLRYVGSAASDSPTIYVRSSPGDEAAVTVVPFPGDVAGRLAGPGTLMVIVADQPSTLQITAQAVSATGSLNAELKLEPLRADVAQAAAPQASLPQVAIPQTVAASVKPVMEPPRQAVEPLTSVERVALQGLRMIAHVSRRGDVAVDAGVWVGGPDAPSPIEGISVSCPADVGVVHFQVLGSGDQRWSEWLSSGMFGGSRGRALPLVGVRLRLTPAPGSSASLVGEALFLGSAIVRKEGLELEFRSAAGLDPLLGLRIEVRGETATREPRPSLVSSLPPSGRVRVFRASGRRSG